jgi:O-antigen ligase
VPVPGQSEHFSLRGVLPEWSLLYLGFLLFEAAIVTYRFPVGKAGVIIGGLALVFSRQKVRFPPPMLALTGLIVIAALGLPDSFDNAASAKEFGEVLKTWLIALVAYNAIRTAKQFRFAMLAAMALYAFVPVRPALMMYAQGITDAGRLSGPFIYINANDLASITILALGVTLWVLAVEPMQKWLRLVGYGFAGTLVVMMFLTQSRGGFLGLIIMTIPYAFSSRRRGLRPLVVVAAVAVAAIVFVPSSAWNRISGIKKLTHSETIKEADPEGSAEQRFLLAQSALDLIIRNPFTGVGIGSVPSAFIPYRRGIGGRDPHNTYLKMAAELGIPGLLVYIAMIVMVWRALTRGKRAARARAPTVAAGLANLQYALLGFLVASLFGSYAWLSIFHLFLAIMWSGAMVWATAPNTLPEPARVAEPPDRSSLKFRPSVRRVLPAPDRGA